MPLQTEKEPSKVNITYLAVNEFIVFSATILRPLTYARNYANLRPRKKQCSEGTDKALRLKKIQ